MSRLFNPRVISIGALLIAITSVQTGATLAKQLFPLLGAEGTTALRQGFTAIILFFVFRVWTTDFKRLNWKILSFYGASLGVMNLTFYMAIERIPLGIAVALEFIGPLAVALWSSRRLIDFVWIACVVLGLYWLLPLSAGSGHLDPLGVVYALIAAFFWGVYIIIGQKAGSAMHGGIAVALGMAISCLITLPIGFAHSGMELLAPAVIPLGIGVAILSCAIPYSLEMVALTRLPAKTFSLMMSLEPAVGALSGFIFLSEHLTLTQILAVGLIVVAAGGSSLTAKSHAVVEEPSA
jgi:inner membrane transporter RhtA